MLAEDATFSMPPLATWYGGPEGRENLTDFMHVGPLSGEWRWKPVRVRANGQEALAFYEWSDEEQAYLPFALNVLTFRGEEIADVTCFICRSTEATDRARYGRYPDEPVDPAMREIYFTRFGLPERLDAARRVSADAIAELRRSFAGAVISPADAGYDHAGAVVTTR